MTSYSTYMTSRLHLVDGSLSPDDELREEQIEQLVNCLASGAARALLDTVHDNDDEDAEVYAEQWHSANEGWELDALDDEARATLLADIRRFVEACHQPIIDLADRLAWGDKFNTLRDGDRALWFHDEGMAFYRIGQCFGYQVHGDGISVTDYRRWQLVDGKPVAGNDITDTLYAWIADRTNVPTWYEDTNITSAEEPCQLHLH